MAIALGALTAGALSMAAGLLAVFLDWRQNRKRARNG